MYFKDLFACNKDWESTTRLIICTSDSADADSLIAKAALSLYGSRKVIWFKDCVVILL